MVWALGMEGAGPCSRRGEERRGILLTYLQGPDEVDFFFCVSSVTFVEKVSVDVFFFLAPPNLMDFLFPSFC